MFLLVQRKMLNNRNILLKKEELIYPEGNFEFPGCR